MNTEKTERKNMTYEAIASLGTPLYDFAVINLDDSETPLERIYRRIEMAAGGDFVVCICNPCSEKGINHLKESFNIISRFRERRTPVEIVKNAGKENTDVTLTTIGKIDYEVVDNSCTVIVGNSQTYTEDGKMITPRGYVINGQ